MNLLWVIPLIAATAATGLVAARARSIEDATVELAREVRRLSQVRPGLHEVRRAIDDTDLLADEFRRSHPVAPEHRWSVRG